MPTRFVHVAAVPIARIPFARAFDQDDLAKGSTQPLGRAIAASGSGSLRLWLGRATGSCYVCLRLVHAQSVGSLSHRDLVLSDLSATLCRGFMWNCDEVHQWLDLCSGGLRLCAHMSTGLGTLSRGVIVEAVQNALRPCLFDFRFQRISLGKQRSDLLIGQISGITPASFVGLQLSLDVGQGLRDLCMLAHCKKKRGRERLLQRPTVG